MVSGKILRKIIQCILEKENLFRYPIEKGQVEALWETIFLESLETNGISDGLPEKEYQKIYDSTLGLFLTRNLEAAEKSVEEYFELQLNEMSVIVGSENAPAEIMRNLNELILRSQQEFNLLYMKNNNLLKDSRISSEQTFENFVEKVIRFVKNSPYPACKEINENISELTGNALAEINLLMEDILQHSVKEQYLFISQQIEDHQREITSRLYSTMPQVLLDHHLKIFKQEIITTWMNHRSSSIGSIENRFILCIQDFLSRISSKSITLFDQTICDSYTSLALFKIITLTVPKSFDKSPMFEKISRYLNTDRYMEILYQGPLEGAESDLTGEAFLMHSTQESRYLAILSLVLMFSGMDECIQGRSTEITYPPKHREWLRGIIYTAFERKYEENLESPAVLTEWSLVLLLEQHLAMNYPHIQLNLEDLDINAVLRIINSDNSLVSRLNKFTGKAPSSYVSKGVSLVTSVISELDTSVISKFSMDRIGEAKSLHITLAISGWLSEDDNPNIAWQDLSSFFGQGEIYYVKWDSSTIKQSLKYMIPMGIFALFAAPSLVGTFSSLVGLAKANPFGVQIEKAKLTGRTLAQVIMAGGGLRNTSISLIGFSLGTQVIMSCLQELVGKGGQVHDVVLLGGAAPANIQKWEVCKQAVTGRLVNAFSSRDKALSLLYRLATLKTAIGTSALEVPGVENFDVTDIADGHLEYRKVLSRIFQKLEYNTK